MFVYNTKYKANKFLKEDFKMKLRIVNKRKFIKMNFCIGLLFICIFIFIGASNSGSNIEYKTAYISEGDTLWSIAIKEAENNSYYYGKDIRDIIQNLKKINNLYSSDITVGEKIIIPSF